MVFEKGTYAARMGPHRAVVVVKSDWDAARIGRAFGPIAGRKEHEGQDCKVGARS